MCRMDVLQLTPVDAYVLGLCVVVGNDCFVFLPKKADSRLTRDAVSRSAQKREAVSSSRSLGKVFFLSNSLVLFICRVFVGVGALPTFQAVCCSKGHCFSVLWRACDFTLLWSLFLSFSRERLACSYDLVARALLLCESGTWTWFLLWRQHHFVNVVEFSEQQQSKAESNWQCWIFRWVPGWWGERTWRGKRTGLLASIVKFCKRVKQKRNASGHLFFCCARLYVSLVSSSFCVNPPPQHCLRGLLAALYGTEPPFVCTTIKQAFTCSKFYQWQDDDDEPPIKKSRAPARSGPRTYSRTVSSKLKSPVSISMHQRSSLSELAPTLSVTLRQVEIDFLCRTTNVGHGTELSREGFAISLGQLITFKRTHWLSRKFLAFLC